MNKETWQNIIDGDKNAYADLYIFYFKKFFNYGRKFTTDIALIEDSIQEVFLDIWDKKDRWAKIDSATGYFFSSFRYTLFKKLKSAKQVSELKEWEGEPEFSVEYITIKKETADALQTNLEAALQSLTPRQREAIFLRFYEGLPYEEVAAVLGISVKATYKIMARSLLSLKDKLVLSLVNLILLLRFGHF